MSVIKRGEKGVFYMNFMVHGVRVYRSTGKYTKKEAKKVEMDERQKMSGSTVEMSPQERTAKMSLKDAIDLTNQTRWKDNKDGKRTYERSLKLVGLIGNLPIGNITEDIVFCMIQKLEKKKYAIATINRYLAHLKTVLKGRKQEYDYIKLKRERNGRIRVVTKQEEQIIVDKFRNTQHTKRRYFYPEVADLVELLVDTGMRIGEALNLNYQDINFDTSMITIWENKADHPRSVPMTSRVKAILLRRHLGADKVFTMQQYQAQNAFRWVRKEMGLEKEVELCFHSLRHSFASRLVCKGVDIYTVQNLLGHKSLVMTSRYSHLSPTKLTHAVNILESE
jgi:integrase